MSVFHPHQANHPHPIYPDTDISSILRKREIEWVKKLKRYTKKQRLSMKVLFRNFNTYKDDPIYNDMNFEEKIKHQHNQEAMRIVDKANYSIHNIFATPDIERFQGPEENFIQDAKKSTFDIRCFDEKRMV